MGFLFSLNCVPLWFVARILYVYMSSVAPPPPRAAQSAELMNV